MIKSMAFMVSLLLVALVIFLGCSEAPEPTAEEEVGIEATAVTEQTICPVMDKPINKALFTEYEGKKVYFCCSGCEDKFKAEPQAFVADLPQFK